ncbi:MAG TPA: NBR1-Ig-like domain-containing protein [Amycolatopsis sp.]|nr:NBR1-Ig-like domain-containing protein [Amycolatopsis sp.]
MEAGGGPGRRGRVARGPDVRTGPVGEFAYRLWELKKAAGDPSYDRMRAELGALASKSALSAAARGRALPSWDTTWEFVRVLAVRALGDDEATTRRDWRARWERARDGQCDDDAQPGDVVAVDQIAPVAAPVEVPHGGPGRWRVRGRLRWVAVGAGVASIAVIAGAVALYRVPATESAGNANTVDASVLVRDVSIPDGTEVEVSSRFVKTWEFRNAGAVPWVGRYLKRENSFHSPDTCETPDRVPILPTQPGQTVLVSVDVQAPPQPGWCQVRWKMVDENDQVLLPEARAAFFLVEVVR